MNHLLVPIGSVLLCALGLALRPAVAEDKPAKQPENKPTPPRVVAALSLALKTGATNTVVIRGYDLTNVTDLRFTNEGVKASIILGKGTRAEVPKESDAKKVGDNKITAEIFLPADTFIRTNWFTVTSPDGTSVPRPLLFLPAAELIEEREPNGGFLEAQALTIGQTISGTIDQVGDVDVFRFTGTAGQMIRLHIVAAVSGSALDSLLTLYDGKGNLLASNDDASGGRDSLLEAKLGAAGVHYLSVMDANDKAGPTHVYLLRIDAGQ